MKIRSHFNKIFTIQFIWIKVFCIIFQEFNALSCGWLSNTFNDILTDFWISIYWLKCFIVYQGFYNLGRTLSCFSEINLKFGAACMDCLSNLIIIDNKCQTSVPELFNLQLVGASWSPDGWSTWYVYWLYGCFKIKILLRRVSALIYFWILSFNT